MAAAFQVISSDMVEKFTWNRKVFVYFQTFTGTAITREYSVKINCKLTLDPHWFFDDWLTKDRPMAEVNDRKNAVDWFGALPLPKKRAPSTIQSFT